MDIIIENMTIIDLFVVKSDKVFPTLDSFTSPCNLMCFKPTTDYLFLILIAWFLIGDASNILSFS
jgi:hypothetical protein